LAWADALVAGNSSRRIVIVDKPDAPQTVLRIGHVGVPRSHPEYVGIEVMNTAFGGIVSSRINLNLRETHGYTYGASSAFAFWRGAGPFLIGTSVRTDVTAPAVAEIFNEITRMREGILTLEELATAKDSIARSLPSLSKPWNPPRHRAAVHSLPLPSRPEGISDFCGSGAHRVEIYAARRNGQVRGDREKIELTGETGPGPIGYRDPAGNLRGNTIEMRWQTAALQRRSPALGGV
jgi:zinc protease